MDKGRVLMLPGLGADEGLFALVAGDFADGVCPDWGRSEAGESVGEFARRWAGGVDLSVPFVVLGFSFGGMVALEAAARTGDERFREMCRGIYVVSGCRSRDAITAEFRTRARGLRRIPDFLLRAGLVNLAGRFSPADVLDSEARGRLREMARRTDLEFFRWAAGACGEWDYPGPEVAGVDCRVFQVHGELDKVIPGVPGHADEVWEGMGHLLVYTAAERVVAGVKRLGEEVGLAV